MKISNNALNFLLAQYRAIFKRAYVKGIASAVLLTAGLAVGQAQAATALTDTKITTNSALATADQEILIGQNAADDKTANYNKITISGIQTNNTTGTWNANVTLNSGEAGTANYIKGTNGSVTLTGDGSLTIDIANDNAEHGLAISGGSNGATVSIGSINVATGTLAISDSTGGNAKVVAGEITIGVATPAANPTTRATPPKYTGILTLSSAVNAKNATLGDANSVITIDNTGKLEVTAGSGTTSISGASLTLNKDAMFLTKRTGDKAAISTTLAVDELTALEGSFHIVSGTDTKTFTQEFTGKTASFGGNLLITKDATLDLKTKLAPATGGIEGQGVVTLEGTSNTVLGGTLKVSSGTLVVADGAQLNASVEKATIAIAETSSSKSTLKIRSSTLKQFLDGGNADYQAINTNGTTDKASAPSEKGAVTISSGTLHFTDDNVTLSKFGFKATNDVDSNSEAGKITFNSGSVTNIVGKNFTIEKQLSTKDGAGSKIQLKANSLTLGGSSVADYGFKSATVANLYETATGTVELGNAVTLDVTLGDQVVVDGTSGVLSGDFILTDADKSITVAHGTFTQEGSLTISGGSLTVQNERFTDPNAQNIDTKLTLSNLTLKADGSKITVDGKNNDAAATILDLSEISKSEFNVSGGQTSSGSITVQNGGTLIATGEQVRAILDAEGTKGFAVKVDKGTLEVEGNLTLDATNELASDASAFDDNKITFHKTNGGTLSVDGKLTLEKAGTVKLANVDITAETLALNTATSGTAVTLSGGEFTAWAGLEGDAGIEVSGSTTMFLGGFDYNNAGVITGVKSSSGNIKTDLIINGGDVTVQNGSWKGQTISISGGNFIVGDASKVDANNNTFATALSVNEIEQTGAATTNISTVGSVETKSLTISDGTFTVNGAMTVDGVYKAAVPGVGGAAGTPASYGVELAAGKLKVSDNANLTFGTAATKAITVNTTNDTSGDGWISIADNTFGKGDNTKSEVIGVGVGSTITFGFESGTSFGADALAEFRKEIFGLESGNLAGFVNLGDAQIADLTEAIKNNEIAYDDLKGYIDVNSDFTTEALQNVKVTGIDSSSELRGSLGSLSSTELGAGEQIAVDGNLALNNAAANGGKFAANAAGEILGLNVTENANVTLNKGGEIGTVSFSNEGSFVVASENGTTKIAAIDGARATTKFATGTATVTDTTETAQLTTDAGTNTTFVGDVTVGQRAAAGTTSSLAGDATFQGAATFYQNAEVAHTGSATFAKDVAFEGNAAFYGDTTVEGTATTKSDITIEDDAVVTIKNLVTQGNIFVGSLEGDHAGAGTLSVETLSLKGNELVVDPAWDNATGLAFVGVNKFTDATTSDAEAGILNGQAYALQNSILSIGNKDKDDVLAIFDKYINAQGNLSNDKDGVGAIVYVADTVEVAANGKIVADKTQNRGTYDDPTVAATYGNYGVYIGDNSVLGVEVSAANGADAAITFAGNNDVTIKATNSGKIVLTGDYDQNDTINLFADKNGTDTVTIADGKTIRVETINGLLVKDDFNGQAFNISAMDVDTKRAASAFSATSSPVHESLVAYGTGNTDWRNANKQNADQKLAAKTHGAAVSGVIASIDNNGNVTYYREPSAEGEAPVEITDTDETKYYTVVNVLNPEYKEGVQGSQQYLPKVFLKADNALLSAINNVQANSGISAESAARMADFAGVAQVALKAGSSTSDAISGRMGMGAQNGAITYANNGQGAGLWVTPIYMNSDSDGFEAQGISYGTDINLYGVALGGDYTLANGIRVGAMFNVGSGDVDGQGAGSNVSSDFDYYGLGLYAGYTMGQFSIVGDISYTAVDNDLEANTEFAEIGKLETSLDSSNISFGVTGAYAFDTAAGVQVTPHVGLRYSYIDIDDYTVDSKKGVIGSYSADSLSVFSIPVGVTIASEFNAGSWSVKPSFDVTLTGNFGDDENEGTFHWNGVENIDCGLTSEIFDNFTYGATLGVAAQSASGISLGLSVGYTGSSNVDDFGVNANARFTF